MHERCPVLAPADAGRQARSDGDRSAPCSIAHLDFRNDSAFVHALCESRPSGTIYRQPLTQISHARHTPIALARHPAISRSPRVVRLILTPFHYKQVLSGVHSGTLRLLAKQLNNLLQVNRQGYNISLVISTRIITREIKTCEQH